MTEVVLGLFKVNNQETGARLTDVIFVSLLLTLNLLDATFKTLTYFSTKFRFYTQLTFNLLKINNRDSTERREIVSKVSNKNKRTTFSGGIKVNYWTKMV